MTSDIRSIVTNAAQRYGLEPETMLAIAQIESTMGTRLDNPESSAGGLYQFIDKSWKQYGNGKSKYDHEANADAGMRLARDNSKYLSQKLGRKITAGEFYLAHQQGAGGAYKILREPERNAVQSLGEKKVRLNVPRSMRKDGSYKTLTNAQFAQLWSRKMDKAKSELGLQVSPSQISQTSQQAPQGSQQVISNSLSGGANKDYSVLDAAQGSEEKVGYDDVTPPNTLSNQERKELTGETQTDVLDAARATLEAEWSVWQLGAFSGPEDKPDPDWVLDLNERDKHLTEGIPSEYWDRFSDAVSAKHAERISEGLREELKREAQINSLGAGGTALRIGAALTDPGAWGLTAAMAGTGNFFGAGAMAARRFGKAGQIALGALEGAASNTLIDSALIAGQYTRDKDELLYSVGTGLVIGGAFGAISRTPVLQEEALAIEALGRKIQDQAADDVIENMKSTAGAARTAAKKDLRTDTYTDRVATQSSAPDGPVASSARFDISASMKRSKNSFERELGNHLVEDGARNGGDDITPIATSEIQTLLFKRFETNWRRSFDTSFREHAQRKGIGWAKRRSEKLKFSEDVYRYVTDRNPSGEFDEAVKKVGSDFRKMMDEWRELANNPGAFKGLELPGLRDDFLEANPHYAPRVPNQMAIRELVDEFGQENLDELVAAAVKEWNPKLDPAIASRIGKGYITKMHKLTAGQELGASRIFNGEDLDQLKEVLEEFELSTDEISQTLKLLEQRKKGGERSRMKSRLTFDEQFKAKVRNKHGEVREVTLNELFVRDADHLMQLYSRHMSGDIALANLRIKNSLYDEGSEASEFLVDGVRKDADWTTLKERVRSVGEAQGQSGKEIDETLGRLDFVYNAIRGTPNFNEASDWSQFLRLLRDYNFVRVMGQVGFAQLPEFANLAGQVGWKTMLTSMPSMRSLLRNAKTGKLEDGLAEEIEGAISVGTDALRMNTIFRNDDAAFGSHAAFANKWLQKLDNGLFEGKKIVANASLMTPVNTLLQRWAGKAMFNKFAQMAEGKAKINWKRLKGLGLDEEMTERVFAQIRKNAKYEDVQGRKLKQLDIASWTDLEAANAFEMAVFRWSRSAVQENDIGQFAAWMSHPLARTFLQFRTFILAAWSKQFLQGLNYRDAEAFTAFAGTVFAGGMVYTAQTYLNAIGREDRDEWLEKRLEPKRLVTSAFQRSSWFSLLAPGIDLGSQIIVGEPLFDGRTTGLQGVLGNPTADLGDKSMEALGTLSASLQGDEMSKQGAYAMRSILPFQNLIGITHMFNLMVTDLPQYSRSQY